MDMTLPVMPESGIGEADRELIRLLARSLTPEQALWAGGYLAGAAQARSEIAALGAEASGVIARARAPEPPPVATIRILYASETGNAAALARDLEGRAKGLGLAAEAEDLARYKTRGLKNEQAVLFITSTHGEGDPPGSAAGFFEFLQGRKAPSLEGLRYAVLALGDSTYEFFCEAGRRLDRQLEALGARRLVERQDCDVDYAAAAHKWMDAALGRLADENAKKAGPASAVPSHAGVVAGPVASPARQPACDKTRPFPAQVITHLRITGRDSSKDTRHIEFDLEGSDLDYLPGDALGITPRNAPALVTELAGLFGWSGSETLAAPAGVAGGGETTLAEALSSGYEITALTPRFIEQWAALSGDRELAGLAADRPRLAAFMASHHVIDVVRSRPVPGLAPQDFIRALRSLQPRLYSIASSSVFAPDEVHICLAPVRYSLHGRDRRGVASAFLADVVQPGDLVPVYVQRNDNFRLPQDPATPIVMIGAGTGVAPYRAFLQHREAAGAGGRSWLFFGERRFRSDFLYQTEWQDWLKSGLLGRIDLAFSRDQAAKIYVQDRIRERGAELFGWLEEGAHVYVCGDAEHMARDVHATLLAIVAAGLGRDEEDAREYLQTLQSEGRYQRDVY